MSRKSQRQPLTYEIRATGHNYEQIKEGFRNFIIVPDDRLQGYEIGDMLIIQKYSYDKKIIGELITKKIRGMQKRGPGLLLGFVVLGLLNCKDYKEPEN